MGELSPVPAPPGLVEVPGLLGLPVLPLPGVVEGLLPGSLVGSAVGSSVGSWVGSTVGSSVGSTAFRAASAA